MGNIPREIANRATNVNAVSDRIEAKDGDRAFIWSKKINEHADCRGFARTVWPKKTEHLARPHV
jgi:hypothetical protein